MEMRCEELAYRLLSLTSGVGLGKILDGNLNDKEMDKIIREGVDFLMGCPIFLMMRLDLICLIFVLNVGVWWYRKMLE